MSASAFTTPDALALYMLTDLGPLAADLGLGVDDFAPAVDDALYSFYGDAGGVITGITSVADLRKLRALARVEAWRTAVSWSAADIDNSTDGQSFSFSQRHAHAVARLADARTRAAMYASENEVVVTTLVYGAAVDPFYRATSTTEF